MGTATIHITLTLGLLLAAALLGAILAETVRVPKVTAYLLVGLLLGPHVLELLPAEHVERLEPFNDMAMALVLFNLGCQFSLDRFRVLLRHLLPISLGEQTLCLVLVGLATGLVTHSVTIGLLLGIMAVATAPATTVLVLKEAQSEGPVTDLTGGLVAFNNLTCIVLFELAYVAVHLATGGTARSSILGDLGGLASSIATALGLGTLAGLVVSYFCGLIAGKRWLVLLIAVLALVLGLCEVLEVPYLLAFLTMGVVVVNTSTDTRAITRELDQLTTLLCVLFFVLHGSHLNVEAFLQAGAIGLLYISARMIGKYAGVYLMTRHTGEDPQVRSWLGLTLMAQAGVAIALSATAVKRQVPHAREIQSIILGSVVFFEILGPLMIRHAVRQAGEMPLGQAIHHVSTTPLEQLNAMWNRLLVALGRDPAAGQPAAEVPVAAVTTRDVKGIPQSADFAQVINYIEHSHDNVFPVVDAQGVPTGIIRYTAISGANFDPDAVDLVCADDLAEPLEVWVTKSDSLARVTSMFRDVTDDCIVVTDPDAGGRLFGLVRRSDIMNMLIRGRRKAMTTTGNGNGETPSSGQ